MFLISNVIEFSCIPFSESQYKRDIACLQKKIFMGSDIGFTIWDNNNKVQTIW